MPSKSNDAVEAALSRAVDDIQALVRASGASAPVVLIDGRSGAGKTSLSRRLAVSRRDAYVLALDSVYPGWDGLRAGADHVIDNVLTPRVRGAEGSWNGWNWQLDVPETASHVVPLNCVEAEALSDLLNTIGYRAAAASWIVKHSETDEPDEKEAHA